MSGRDTFEKHSKTINVLFSFYKLIPNFLVIRILSLVDGLETKEALLLRYFYVKNETDSCGSNIYIGKYVTLKNLKNLKLGSNISIHAYSYIDAYGDITIQDNVSVANHTSIISFNHTWSDKKQPIKYNPVEKAPIFIYENVWIGNGCRLLPGIIVGSKSIIAAGAVVSKNVESNTIVAGIPAKKIKEI